MPSPCPPCSSLESRISMLTPARPRLFTIAATSLTVVPSVLHAMAPRRVACELPGGVVLRSLYSQENRLRRTQKGRGGGRAAAPRGRAGPHHNPPFPTFTLHNHTTDLAYTYLTRLLLLHTERERTQLTHSLTHCAERTNEETNEQTERKSHSLALLTAIYLSVRHPSIIDPSPSPCPHLSVHPSRMNE
jgi:hypothetical protein